MIREESNTKSQSRKVPKQRVGEATSLATLRLCPFALCCLCFCAWAPPKLNTFFPAGAQRGQAVTVTASGAFSNWPVKAWVDRPGVEVVAAEEKGKLTVRIATDASPGTYWVRLYDQEGATSPRPFVVGTLPEVLEAEPNDDVKKPQVLGSSTVVNGRLEKAGDVDAFAVQLRKGQTLVASLEANRSLGSAMDATLQIVSDTGFVLAQNDDYHDLDPQVVFTAPADATFLIRAFAFPAVAESGIRFSGSPEFIYRLTITTGGFVEYAFPLALSRGAPLKKSEAEQLVELRGWNIPELARQVAVAWPDDAEAVSAFHAEVANTASISLEPHSTIVEHESNSMDSPQDIRLPVTISGRITGGDRDVFRFQCQKGDKLQFRADSRALGFPLDPFLRLTDESGMTLAEIDDSSGGRDSEINFTVPSDGPYRLIVRDLHGHGGDFFVYRLRAGYAVPDFELKLAADSFVLTPGKPLEIPVAIERTNGFAGEIDIVVEGLTDCVSAVPAKSMPTGDSAKSVKLVVTSTAGSCGGSVRIVGRSAGDKPHVRNARAVLTGLGASTVNLWVTVLKVP